MWIECLIQRDGPTHLTIDGFDYVFAANKYGRKVGYVMSTAHQNRLLALKDYVPYEGPVEKKPESIPEVTEEEPDLLLKTNGEPYGTRFAAKRGAMQTHGLAFEDLEIVPYLEGYAVRVL